MAYPGTLHLYTSRLVAFEFYSSHENTLLFIGGLGDGLLTVPYLAPLADAADKLDYNTAQLLISSSYTGWGTGSLARDAQEIDAAIAYFRSLRKGKIVLMGHSTGCQDTMHFLTTSTTNTLDGAILQAPVSDREAMRELFADRFDRLLHNALKQRDEGRGEDVLPQEYSQLFFGSPISANRWISLAEKNGDDDFFSSDLDDDVLKTTFGNVRVPLCVLISGSDEFMKTGLDKQALFERWRTFAHFTGGVIDGATHNVGATSAQNSIPDLIRHVSEFLLSIS